MLKNKNKTIRCLVFIWLTGTYFSSGEVMSKIDFITQNNLLFDKRVSLLIKVLADVDSNEIFEKLARKSVLDEIEGLEKWLEIDFPGAFAHDGQIGKGLAESERKGRMIGLLDEMRSAMEGFHKDLPNNSTLAKRIKIVRLQIEQFNQILKPTIPGK
jgi:hypothetical protein